MGYIVEKATDIYIISRDFDKQITFPTAVAKHISLDDALEISDAIINSNYELLDYAWYDYYSVIVFRVKNIVVHAKAYDEPSGSTKITDVRHLQRSKSA